MLRRPSALFLGAAWVCFVISFFLPVTKGMFGMSGVDAAVMCAKILVQPWADISFGGWMYYGLFTIPNLLMVSSPFLWALSQRQQNHVLWLRVMTVLSVLYVGSVVVLFHDDGLRSGYFLWVASFILLAGGAHVNAKEIGQETSKHLAPALA